MEGEVRSELAELERRASELVKLYKQYNLCTSVELFFGEDSVNRTYTYFSKCGLQLPRTTEVLSRLLSTVFIMPYGGGGWRIDVIGAYAITDGIVVQLHKVVLNKYGPVKDYGSFPSLSTLLAVEERARAAAEEILAAVREDIEELERELNKMIENPVRSYTIERLQLRREEEYEEGAKAFFSSL